MKSAPRRKRGARVVLVGQAPNSGGRSDAPLTGRAGRRIMDLAELSLFRYVKTFKRANVLSEYPGKAAGGEGDAFPMAEARRAAAGLAKELVGCTVVLLGRGVAKAFGVSGDAPLFLFFEHDGMSMAVAPHPSGINRWWNARSHVEAAEEFWRGLTRE